MEEILNKPRVFLSHSKKDIKFIERLYTDLSKCQIDPWLDSIEIRHGKPWLDSIFEYGIPTCDCVLVYLTPSSVKSTMVKKEIDASILQTLKDNKVSFLPYVSNSNVRGTLRLDIQALQIPEWNDNNYNILLPQVVSEIWRNYLERLIIQVRQNEKVPRLEAELELEKLRKADTIFSISEENDFKYIYEYFNKVEKVSIQEIIEENGKEQSFNHKFNINIGTLIPLIGVEFRFNWSTISRKIVENLLPELIDSDSSSKNKKRAYGEVKIATTNLNTELLTFDLIRRQIYQEDNPTPMWLNMARRGPQYTLIFTEKMQRYRYWLGYNKLMPQKIDGEIAEQ